MFFLLLLQICLRLKLQQSQVLLYIKSYTRLDDWFVTTKKTDRYNRFRIKFIYYCERNNKRTPCLVGILLRIRSRVLLASYVFSVGSPITRYSAVSTAHIKSNLYTDCVTKKKKQSARNITDKARTIELVWMRYILHIYRKIMFICTQIYATYFRKMFLVATVKVSNNRLNRSSK